MSTPKVVGDANGIKLWNIMSESTDELEQRYFVALNGAAVQYGSIWFADSITQRNDLKNQTTWGMKWNEKLTQWEVSLFHIPENVNKVSARIESYGQPELIELDLEDILVDEG